MPIPFVRSVTIYFFGKPIRNCYIGALFDWWCNMYTIAGNGVVLTY